jgi:hypothetical protein
MILHLNMEMIDHCISYILLNKMTIYEKMIFLSAKTTAIDGESTMLVCALTKFIPNSLSW